MNCGSKVFKRQQIDSNDNELWLVCSTDGSGFCCERNLLVMVMSIVNRSQKNVTCNLSHESTDGSGFCCERNLLVMVMSIVNRSFE